MHVDVSQLETLLSVGGELLLEASVMGQPERRGNRSATVAPQGVYRCIGPDEWLALSIGTDQEWEAFLGVLGDSELELDAYRTRLGRLSAQDAIDVRIGLWSAQRSKHIAMAELQAVGVRAGAVMTNADLVEERPPSAHWRLRAQSLTVHPARKTFRHRRHPTLARQVTCRLCLSCPQTKTATSACPSTSTARRSGCSAG